MKLPQQLSTTSLAIALLASMTVATSTTAAAESAAPTGADSSSATFEGRTIDLAANRGAANACAITATGNRCYRTEAAMDEAEALLAPPSGDTKMAGSNCSTSVRLYADTGHTGTITSFTTRGTWINLSAYGIDNTTSSYKIGACSAAFRANAAGGGSSYPGSTSAGASATSMASGWDNVVSSIRLS